MRELHLFAGIGGGILAGRLLGHTCVGAVEIDPYCRRVLAARQADHTLAPAFPIHDDIRTFSGTAWRGRVDIVCGGFPCQPWSAAGKRLGAADPRHLWPEMARVVSECRPAFVFAENVTLRAFAEPWRDLRAMGYRVAPALQLGACDLGPVLVAPGAPMFHRHRWWLLAADAHQQRQPGRALSPGPGPEGSRAACAARSGARPRHLDGARLSQREGVAGHTTAQRTAADGAAWWSSPSRLVRLVSGHARRVESRRDRIRAVGNAQVPLVAAEAFRRLMRLLSLEDLWQPNTISKT